MTGRSSDNLETILDTKYNRRINFIDIVGKEKKIFVRCYKKKNT